MKIPDKGALGMQAFLMFMSVLYSDGIVVSIMLHLFTSIKLLSVGVLQSQTQSKQNVFHINMINTNTQTENRVI